MKRIKLILLYGSLGFMVFLNLYKNNFYKKVTINKWRQLEWNDFQGTKRPFTMYGAAIYSGLYLDEDSVGSTYCYAGQNNQLSWTDNTSVYGLNHEQYHFNITEIFARRMNEFIEQNPDPETSLYGEQLKDYKRELRIMQNNYDDETDHSLNRGPQGLWEYKIDSMLHTHSGEDPQFIDHYSGLSIYFPDTPLNEQLVSQGSAVRVFQLPRYGMSLTAVSFQSNFQSPEEINKAMEQERLEQGNIIISFKGSSNSSFWIFYHPEMRKVDFELWRFRENYTYYATTGYDSDSNDSLAFSTIAETFVSSLKIVEQSGFWQDKATASEPTERQLPTENGRPGDEDYGCMVLREDIVNGFYAEPIISPSDTLLVPYQIMNHPDSLILQAILSVGNVVFTSDKQTDEHIFKIAMQDLPPTPFEAKLGYLLKKDSTEGCYQYYNQSILIDPK